MLVHVCKHIELSLVFKRGFINSVWILNRTTRTPLEACENRRHRPEFRALFLTNLAVVPVVCQIRFDPAYSAVIPAAAVDWRYTAAMAVHCCRIDVPVLKKLVNRADDFTKYVENFPLPRLPDFE